MKTFLILIITAFSLSSYAQESTPFGYIQASLAYSTNKDVQMYSDYVTTRLVEYTNTSTEVSPSFSKFVTNSLAVGLGIGYSRHNSSNTSVSNNQLTNSSKISTVSPFIFLEKFIPLSDKFYFTGIGFISGQFSNQEELMHHFDIYTGSVISHNSQFNKTSFEISFHPSVRYQMFKKVGLQLVTGKLSYKKVLDDSSYDDYSLDESEFKLSFATDTWKVGLFLPVELSKTDQFFITLTLSLFRGSDIIFCTEEDIFF